MPIERLKEGNRRFRQSFAQEQELHRALAEEGQQPQVLWIGCSDSRVVPEQIVGAQPGELFVVRNIANLVPPAGSGASTVGAVIEYGVLHLQVGHIVVCGHTDCGGIRALAASADPAREPHIAQWLAQARPIWEETASQNLPPEERHLEVVRRSALRQRTNLASYPAVATALESGALRIHVWLYDLRSGGLLAHDDDTGEWRPLS